MAAKLIIFALDGATLDLIRPWAAEGYLPNLKKLMDCGISGDLLSTYPPLTGPAWGSFATGKSPGHHGVLEFFQREQDSYRQILNNRQNLDGKSLWKILSENEIAAGIMGLPLTYPPEPIDNGFVITGLLTPPDSRNFTHPEALLDEIEEQIGPYRLRHDAKYRKSDPWPFIQEQYENLENNALVADYLMTHKSWDLFMVHFLGTDRIQHEFWHVLDPDHPQHDPEERRKLGNVVLDFHKAVDAKVGELVARLDDDVSVLVMSDHGFGPIDQFVNLNPWLLQQGLLRLKPTLGASLRRLTHRIGFNYSMMGRLVLRLGLGQQAKELGRERREMMQRRYFLSLNDVDWSRTRVYSMGNFGQLYVNLKGREPQGIVSPGQEYDSLLDDLTDRLLKLADPKTGAKVIEDIFRREEVYDGPYAQNSPDLMFTTKEMRYKAMGLSDFSSPRIFEPVYGTTGHHRANGIMIWRGPSIKKTGNWNREVRIQDLAPTILYYFGLQVPSDMDGRVILGLFTDEFREKHTVSYSSDDDRHDGPGESPYTAEEEESLTEMLRNLGYVS